MNYQYFKIRKDEIWTGENTAVLNVSRMKWEPAKPELYTPNLKEWFVHNILRKHFSFGQPYCVVCGYAKQDNTN